VRSLTNCTAVYLRSYDAGMATVRFTVIGAVSLRANNPNDYNDPALPTVRTSAIFGLVTQPPNHPTN
jgi:hypothetical protein